MALKVKNLVISKQVERSKEYNQIIEIANQKGVNVIFVEAGQRINIEKNLFFDILWPNKNEMVRENPLNNNSIVAKLNFYKFQILFTGDIEKIAEEKIVQLYGNRLKTNILKVAHHGSKTSSTEEFIKATNPQIVLIGVGLDNKYGHPDKEVMERLKKGSKILRTDLMGEIRLEVNKNGKIVNNTNR